MASQGREPLPQRGTGGEIASDKLKPEAIEDRPPGVEVSPAVLQVAHGALGELELRGELTLGEPPRLAVLPEFVTECEIGRKFAQIRWLRGPKPARSLI